LKSKEEANDARNEDSRADEVQFSNTVYKAFLGIFGVSWEVEDEEDHTNTNRPDRKTT
jgi:hypothetical protein